MSKPQRAAIYCRISKDDRGDLLGVRRQEADCRKLAEAKRWPVAEVLVDDDVSAYVPGKRPAYARLLEGLKVGDLDAVLVYDLDRLHRHPWELEEFFRIVDAAGTVELASVAGDYDLATNDGRLMARIMGAVAKKESDDKSRRLRRKHEELAERGLWKGGPRPYGWRSVGGGRLEVVPEEAAIVREAAARVLAGESLNAIAIDLNERSVPTARGARWRTPSLRSILTTPKVAGYREHKGEVVGPAGWDPLLSEDDWRRLHAIIHDPSRARGARPARSYLLTGGLARCGRCGHPLESARRTNGARIYRCGRSVDKDGCGKLQVAGDPFEALVTEAVILRADTPGLAEELAQATGDGDDVAAELETIDARLAELAEVWAAGDIDRAEWMAARKPLEARRDAARRREARQARSTALDPYTAVPGALRAAWPELTLDQRRTVIGELITAVTVRPATRRGPGLDPTRVDIEWKA